MRKVLLHLRAFAARDDFRVAPFVGQIFNLRRISNPPGRREAASPKLDERSGGDKAPTPRLVAAPQLCGADFQSAADFESACRLGRRAGRVASESAPPTREGLQM